MEYDPVTWPDETYDGPNDHDAPGRDDENPFFTGPRSGKQNYYFCKSWPGKAYCDRKRRPYCYRQNGRGAFDKTKCEQIPRDKYVKQKPPTDSDDEDDPNNKMKWRTKRKFRGKRRYTRRRRRVARRVNVRSILPDYKEIVILQQVVTAVQNERQHIFGSQMSLWTPFDIETYTATNPSANVSNKILLKKGKIIFGLTNFAPNPVTITLWEFTPRSDGYAGVTPTTVYRRGIEDLSGSATAYSNPMSTPYWSKMFCQQFKIKRLQVIRLENGQEHSITLYKNLNKIFSTERLTTPGTTTYTPVVDTNWLEGITTYYGMSFLGGVHDVTTAGTGGLTGVGYGPVRVGVMTQKNYTSQVVTGSVQTDQVIIPSTATLGFAGTTTGAAAISNEDTGTSLATITAGAAVNQA